MDKYNTTDAPNRFSKRSGEQENKKFRDIEKKTFNDLIRKFASTVQKMDERVTKAQENKKKQEEHRKQQQKEFEDFMKEEMKKLSREKRTDFGEGIDLIDEDHENDIDNFLEIQREMRKGKKGEAEISSRYRTICFEGESISINCS